MTQIAGASLAWVIVKWSHPSLFRVPKGRPDASTPCEFQEGEGQEKCMKSGAGLSDIQV